MKNGWIFTLLLFSLLLFSSCSFYSGMKLTEASLKEKILEEEHQINYSFNYLQTVPNAENFSERAQKNNIQLIVMEIENFGIVPMELGRTHLLVMDGKPTPLLDTQSLFESTRQRYRSLGTLLMISPVFGLMGMADEDVDPAFVPALFLVGPIMVTTYGIGRVLVNAQFHQDLINHNLNGVKVLPGEKVRGIVGVTQVDQHTPQKIWLSRLGRF